MVEFLLLAVGEAQGEQPAHDNGLQLVLPLQGQCGEGFFEVAVVAVELVLPVVYGRHVVENLAREEPVFRSGYQRFHLCRSARQKYGKISLFHFAVFLVGAPVVRQPVVVEGFAHGVAPVSVLRADGGGDGIGFAFAYQAGAVRVHQVLQDARSGIVARYEEHLVGRHHGSFGFPAFFAQCVVLCFFTAVACHAFGHLLAYFIVYGFGQQAHQRQHTLARCGRCHHKGLQAGRHHFSAIGTSHMLSHTGTQHGDGPQQKHVVLSTGGTAFCDALQRMGPMDAFVESGQGRQRIAVGRRVVLAYACV